MNLTPGLKDFGPAIILVIGVVGVAALANPVVRVGCGIVALGGLVWINREAMSTARQLRQAPLEERRQAPLELGRWIAALLAIAGLLAVVAATTTSSRILAGAAVLIAIAWVVRELRR